MMAYTTQGMPILTLEQAKTLKALTISFACASIFSSAFVISCYIVFPTLRTLSSRLVMFLCIADLLFSTAHLINFEYPVDTPIPIDSTPICTAQAFLINLSALSSIIWSSVIAFSIYYTVYLGRINLKTKQPIFMLIAYLIPLFMSFVPLIAEAYGPSPGWCYIKLPQNEDQQHYNINRGLAIALYVVEFYAPLLVCFTINCVFIITSVRLLKRQAAQEYLQARKLMAYPLILPICWMPGVVHRILDLWEPHKYHYIASVLHIIFSLSVGIANAFAYGINQNVWKHVRSLCSRSRLASQTNLLQSVNPKNKQSSQSELGSYLLEGEGQANNQHQFSAMSKNSQDSLNEGTEGHFNYQEHRDTLNAQQSYLQQNSNNPSTQQQRYGKRSGRPGALTRSDILFIADD